jgi:PKD repeat protein
MKKLIELLLVSGAMTGFPPEFAYTVLVTDGQATTPKFTFGAGAPAATVSFGDGTAPEAVTSGVEMTHTYTTGGTYTVKLLMTNQNYYLTQVDISSDYVVVPAVWPNLPRFTALTRLIDLWAVGFGEVGVMKVAR